jgi:hypothetical protein
MILCCSPAACNDLETLSTLRFGVRARGIKNSVRANVVSFSPEQQLRAALVRCACTRLRTASYACMAHTHRSTLVPVCLRQAEVAVLKEQLKRVEERGAEREGMPALSALPYDACRKAAARLRNAQVFALVSMMQLLGVAVFTFFQIRTCAPDSAASV